ncbi:MAG: hypothetical protein IKW64_01125 [Clostridia bacterium]|nr:hypothetical protein [Clostridia bacterium]
MLGRHKNADAIMQLVLCGNSFYVQISNKTLFKCRRLQKGIKKRLSLIGRGANKKSVSDSGICKLLCRGIDSLLGKGAAQKIFAERQINSADLSQLACYIISKLSEELNKNKAAPTAK